jgi:hypothetical protein
MEAFRPPSLRVQATRLWYRGRDEKRASLALYFTLIVKTVSPGRGEQLSEPGSPIKSRKIRRRADGSVVPRSHIFSARSHCSPHDHIVLRPIALASQRSNLRVQIGQAAIEVKCGMVGKRPGAFHGARPWIASRTASSVMLNPTRTLQPLPHGRCYMTELLRPLASVHLGRENVALRIDRQIVHPVKLACVAAVPAERTDDLSGFAP